jgi:hypothetical protein
LTVAVGLLPGIASGVPTGTATQVGGPEVCPPDRDGGGQVRISDKIPLPAGCPLDLDLRSCTLTKNPAAIGSPTSIQILFDPGVPAELVRDTPLDADGNCVGVPGFLLPWFTLPPRPGGEPDDVIFESNQAVRPTLRLQVKNRGSGFIEFSSGLKVDRACINDGVSDGDENAFPKTLRTSFRLACADGCNIDYAVAPTWRVSGSSGGCHGAANGSNIRTP